MCKAMEDMRAEARAEGRAEGKAEGRVVGRAEGLDSGEYKTGIKVTDEELGQVNITRSEFRGDWNYVIAPTGVC